MHIFISYAKKDTRPLALDLHAKLNALPGLTAWMDATLEPVASWARQIQDEIDRADYFVVLLSPDVNRPAPHSFVLQEIAYAQQERKTIITVMAQTTKMPLELVGLQYIDLVPNQTTSLANLIAFIQAKATNAALPPKSTIPPIAECIVARTGPANFRTISEAIKNSPEGTVIRIRPGLYRESIVLDKTVEIVGDGPLADIIVESTTASTLIMATDYAVIRGLTLRLTVGTSGPDLYGVDIPTGRLLLADCDITSDSSACIGVHNNGTLPTIRGCKIHDNYKHAGIFIYDNATGRITDCNIFANALAGIRIRTGGDPTVQRCTIHNGKQAGIFVYENGLGQIADCDIVANAYAGILIKTGGNPIVRDCRINNNTYPAIYAHDKGFGTVERCNLTGNKGGAFRIDSTSTVTQRDNIT